MRSARVPSSELGKRSEMRELFCVRGRVPTNLRIMYARYVHEKTDPRAMDHQKLCDRVDVEPPLLSMTTTTCARHVDNL